MTKRFGYIVYFKSEQCTIFMNDYNLCETFNFVFNNSLVEIMIFTTIFNVEIIKFMN